MHLFRDIQLLESTWLRWNERVALPLPMLWAFQSQFSLVKESNRGGVLEVLKEL